MSFRTKLLLAFSAATFVSLSLLALGVRRQLTTRLVAQHQRRVDAIAQVAVQDLARENATVSRRLQSLARTLANDNGVRLALRGAAPSVQPARLGRRRDADDRPVDAPAAGRAGPHLSSGHFRNEFDRLDAGASAAAGALGGPAHGRRGPRAGRSVPCARPRGFRQGRRRHLTLVGGISIDRAFLGRFARDSDVTVSLVTPDGAVSSDSGHRAPTRRASRSRGPPSSRSPTSTPAAAGDSIQVSRRGSSSRTRAPSSTRFAATSIACSRSRSLAAALAGLALATGCRRRSAARSRRSRARRRRLRSSGPDVELASVPRRRDRHAGASLRRDGTPPARERGSASRRRATRDRRRHGAAGQSRHQERPHSDSQRRAASRAGAGARAGAAARPCSASGARRSSRASAISTRSRATTRASRRRRAHARSTRAPSRATRRARRAAGGARGSVAHRRGAAAGARRSGRAAPHSRQPSAQRDRESARPAADRWRSRRGASRRPAACA